MKIIVNNIVTSLEEGSGFAPQKFLEKTGLRENEIKEIALYKTSVDARRGKPLFVSSVEVDIEGEISKIEKSGLSFTVKKDFSLEPKKIDRALENPPVVVGFGPCGMFCALILARAGAKPIILERGEPVDDRIKAVDDFWKKGIFNESSNVQFGEGGAGTFSDGKLTTGINDPLCFFILQEFVAHGAPAEILKKSKPHIGTDYLRKIVKNIREEIISLGGEIRFNEKLIDLEISKGAVKAVITEKEKINTDCVVMAPGHSARDTFTLLAEKGFSMEAKGFSAGVRCEQLQSVIDKGIYGIYAGHENLPLGEYQLTYRKNDRAAYTFCMCPGGLVVNSASQKEGVVTNGMSYFKRDLKNANSAIAVSLSPTDFDGDWRKAVKFQENLEHAAFLAGGSDYKAPFTTVGAFLGGTFKLGGVTPSFTNGVKEAPLNKLMPQFMTGLIAEALPVFGRRVPGFSSADTVLTGFETRTSSPLRILRDENREAQNISGVFPAGEGAGYAGGIVSAAADGIKSALAVIDKYLA